MGGPDKRPLFRRIKNPPDGAPKWTVQVVPVVQLPGSFDFRDLFLDNGLVFLVTFFSRLRIPFLPFYIQFPFLFLPLSPLLVYTRSVRSAPYLGTHCGTVWVLRYYGPKCGALPIPVPEFTGQNGRSTGIAPFCVRLFHLTALPLEAVFPVIPKILQHTAATT